jgi:hypothetical protein
MKLCKAQQPERRNKSGRPYDVSELIELLSQYSCGCITEDDLHPGDDRNPSAKQAAECVRRQRIYLLHKNILELRIFGSFE